MPAGPRFTFGRFELDTTRRRLSADGDPVALSPRLVDILLALVSRPGQIIAKEDLLEVGWRDVAVGDNSLEHAISTLRRTIGADAIETVPRRGYRFAADVVRATARQSDAGLEAMLAPHRAFIEGRAALESLDETRLTRARAVFAAAVVDAPDSASAHVGLAAAAALQFERSRADREPDRAALALAVEHGREACRLDPHLGEAWATLGFALDRAGRSDDARAAVTRAVTLEPDNWRHLLRLSYVSYGEARLRAAHRTLALLPGLPLAHWLAATVHVARQSLDAAERELAAGLAAAPHAPLTQFSAVALEWTLGLIWLARGDNARAEAAFARELAGADSGHLYAREVAANTCYARGALAWRQGDIGAAVAAFAAALERVSGHVCAALASRALGAAAPDVPASASPTAPASLDAALVHAVQITLSGARADAARVVEHALLHAPPSSGAWWLPIEPVLHVHGDPDLWAPALARLRMRAS